MSDTYWRAEYPPEEISVVLARRIDAARPDGVRGQCRVSYDPLTPYPSGRWTVRFVIGGTAKRRKFKELSGAKLTSVLIQACADLGIEYGTPLAETKPLPGDLTHLVWETSSS